MGKPLDLAIERHEGVDEPSTTRRTVRERFGWLIEGAFILAAAGSLYWSGRIAERLARVETILGDIRLELRAAAKDVDRTDQNVWHLCKATPAANCRLKE